jgi:hypothetical protein
MIEYGVTNQHHDDVIPCGSGPQALVNAKEIAASSSVNRKVVRRFVSEWEDLTADPTALEVMARAMWQQSTFMEQSWQEAYDKPPTDEQWIDLTIESERERWREAARNVLSMIQGKF